MARSSRVFCFLGVLALMMGQSLPVAAACPGSAESFAEVVAQDAAHTIAAHGLNVVEEDAFADGSVLVVLLAPGQSVNSLRQSLSGDPRVLAVDEAAVASVAPPSFSSSRILDDLQRASDGSGWVHSPCLDLYFGDGAWAGWASQDAALRTLTAEAQAAVGHCGEGVTVAVIDTGVDAEHPLLEGAVLSGYDFLEDQDAASAEWMGLGGSFRTIVEGILRATASASSASVTQSSVRWIAEESGTVSGSYRAIIEGGSMSVLLARSQSAEFEGLDLPSRFGHGTMVAGLVRLVAPGAQILPLRAFDGAGVGTSTDIARAIYYAVDHGADVINMSFSMDRQSKVVAEALRYARQHGVVVVAAAGNRSTNALTYPASDSKVIGVASSNGTDALADFSNYGSNNADLVAPGVALVSAYPGGHYAAGWGTSFSTPLVAGAAALLRFGLPDDAITQSETVGDILGGIHFVGLQGKVLTGGRLDVLGAVDEAQN